MISLQTYWIIFLVLFVVLFGIDYYVSAHRKTVMSVKESLLWTAGWVAVALTFGATLFFFFPQNELSHLDTRQMVGIKFISGYLMEKSLSVDNLFVFLMIFSLMGVKEINQPKLLHLGILLSIVLRILFIVLGMGLVQKFHWVMYIFGVILIWTAYKMVFTKEEENVDPKSNFLYRTASKIFPIDPNPDAPHFFSRIKGKFHITTLFLVFLVIGSTDVLFAIDSIPAIIGVIKEGAMQILTTEEEDFIAITSNIFAVMGLIALYFALKGILEMFRYIKHGVSFILFFIGIKMLLGYFHPVAEFFAQNSWISLTVILGTLTLSILLSIVIAEKKEIDELQEDVETLQHELDDNTIVETKDKSNFE